MTEQRLRELEARPASAEAVRELAAEVRRLQGELRGARERLAFRDLLASRPSDGEPGEEEAKVDSLGPDAGPEGG